MRHAIVLGLVTLCFAVMGSFAYQFDLSRQSAAQSQRYADIHKDLHRLETQYLTNARILIEILNPQDPLLALLDSAPNTLNAIEDVAERDAQFQALVAKVRVKLLTEPTDLMDDAVLQEWRRITDQMNGALHRRQRLLALFNDTP
jgi:predicted aminopeptidase